MRFLSFRPAAFASVLALASLASCKSKDDDPSASVQPALTVVNLSPNPDLGYDIFVNNAIFAPGLPYRQTTVGTGTYKSVAFSNNGVYPIYLKPSGQAAILDSLKPTFGADRRYSVAILDTGANVRLIGLDDYKVSDNPIRDSISKIRIVQAVLAPGRVDVLLDDELLIQGANYADVSPYIEVRSGSHRLNFRLSDGGAKLYGQGIPLAFQGGKAFTVYTTGSMPDTTGPRAVSVLNQNNY